ncbi:hypothetical protein D083_2123 [Dickeya solani RNS 08.23.3.1.A]|nr:hypothetical protein D083_2123 [Dickeya solani RNS 08.23.3.1.A]
MHYECSTGVSSFSFLNVEFKIPGVCKPLHLQENNNRDYRTSYQQSFRLYFLSLWSWRRTFTQQIRYFSINARHRFIV